MPLTFRARSISSTKPRCSELLAGDIDRDLWRVAFRRRPGRYLARGIHDAFAADIDDHVGIFGERDEVERRDQPALRMAPADERFEAMHMADLQIDNRLVEQFQLVAGDNGPLEVGLEAEALHGRLMHALLEAHDLAAALRLGPVEGQIGVAQQFIARSTGRLGREHEADRGFDIDLPTFDLHAAPEYAFQCDDQFLDMFFDIARDEPGDRVFILAQMGERIVRARDAFQAARQHDQDVVADLLAERLVVMSEPVDIENRQHDIGIGVLRPELQRLLGALDQQRAVG